MHALLSLCAEQNISEQNPPAAPHPTPPIKREKEKEESNVFISVFYGSMRVQIYSSVLIFTSFILIIYNLWFSLHNVPGSVISNKSLFFLCYTKANVSNASADLTASMSPNIQQYILNKFQKTITEILKLHPNIYLSTKWSLWSSLLSIDLNIDLNCLTVNKWKVIVQNFTFSLQEHIFFKSVLFW